MCMCMSKAVDFGCSPHGGRPLPRENISQGVSYKIVHLNTPLWDIIASIYKRILIYTIVFNMCKKNLI